MVWVYVITGLILGLATAGAAGALGGAALGFGLSRLIDQRQRIEEIESDLKQLWVKLQSIAPEEEEKEKEALAPSPPEKVAVREPTPAPEPPAPAPATPMPIPPRPRESLGRASSSSPIDDWIDKARSHLTGASLMVTLGVVVLFFGVAFLLKYAVDRGLLSIELRLIAAALGGIGMLVFGWRTREAKPPFSRVLQGGGVGVLYLTVFAAYRLYDLIPSAPTFLLLVAFMVLSALLAVLQDSRALAMLGTIGGFLAPVLASTGQGSHVALFSYYIVLNIGILSISWFKSWRSLNLAGFVFTFVLSGSWAVRYYRPEFFSTTEPFLIAFFVMYVAIAVMFALRQEPRLVGLVDGTLVFGVPLVTAAFQAGLVKDFEYGLAWSALGFGVFYLGLATFLFRYRGTPLRALCEALLGEGVVFATLAVPFAFEGLVTAAFWALEGAAIVWIGIRQNRLLPRLFGSVLQVLAGFAFLVDSGAHGEIFFANAHFLGANLVAVAALWSSLHFSRGRDNLRKAELRIGWFFFVYGLVWWLGGWSHELETFVLRNTDKLAAFLLFFAFTAFVSYVIGRKLSWRALERVSLGLLPSFVIGLVATVDALGHPFGDLAALGWFGALATFYGLLHASEDREPGIAPYWHAGGFGLVTLLLTWEASYRSRHLLAGVATGTWSDVAWGFVPAALLVSLVYGGRALRWPIAKHWRAYTTLAAWPVAAYLVLWVLVINTTPGDPAPLTYLPLVNPVDLGVAFALLALLVWHRTAADWLDEKDVAAEVRHAIPAGLAFLTLHGVIVRTVHLWTGVPLDTTSLFGSVVVQTAVAVLWAVTGLAGMVAGSRSGSRPLWTIGAVLMLAVVAKLFLVDLSHTGTIARIVSFLGVGVLLLIVGYLSPLPPRESESEVAS